MWLPTINGAVNATYVVRIERIGDGSILHLTNGSTVRSTVLFEVIDGQLTVIEPDDGDMDIPF
jgi:hypothetical protein